MDESLAPEGDLTGDRLVSFCSYGDGLSDFGDGIEYLPDGRLVSSDVLGDELPEHGLGVGVGEVSVEQVDGFCGVVGGIGGDNCIVDVETVVHDRHFEGGLLSG